MKKIQILEALGIPDNLYETSVKVTDLIIAAIEKNVSSDIMTDKGQEIIIKDKFTISDFNFNTINLNVKVIELEQIKKPTYANFRVGSTSEKTKNFKLKNIVSENINLEITIAVPINYNLSKLDLFFKKNRELIIEKISHELKHAYDHFKAPYERTVKRAEYDAVQGKSFGIKSIDDFLYNVYFISFSENLTRPSELISAIKNNKVSQKEFLNFLRKNETYKTLVNISKFTLNNLRRKLKREMKQVNDFFDKMRNHSNIDPKNMTDNEKIEKILELVYINVISWTIMGYKNILATNFIEKIMGFQGEKDRVFRRFVSRYDKFNNHVEFFKFYESYFHNISSKMIKKISKLYAMTNKNN
jgi:hypothetical protein